LRCGVRACALDARWSARNIAGGGSTAVAFSWLVQFGRHMAGASSAEAMHPLVAAAAVERLGVDAAAVLRVAADKLVVSAVQHLPPELVGWSIDALEIENVDRALVAATGFEDARVMMLVVGGNIYGALVLLAKTPIVLGESQRELADAIVDLAAVATERVESYSALAQSYAELKSSRDALARSERLRILGQMAAGISHDVKNILNPLNLQLELLRRRLAKSDIEAARETITTMADVIRHGIDVVDRLREFSRQAPEIAEAVDVERMITTAVELSRPRVAQHRGIELTAETTPAPRIRARASELTTALVNLIVNATEAMPDGGTITVTNGERDGGTWIAVTDNGPGMPADVEQRVFEPFFTTKTEGTGLGLAMIYAFVQRFNGRITLDTMPGNGTTFTLWFPAAS
jgi:signal transduction histidine kinase